VLEVTETELMRNVERATEVLGEIKQLGVRIAVDDFGTGFSSLSQLEHLPVDILKVEREFAGTPEDRSEHAKLLRAVMEIGDSLHLRTIAEGIETPDQLEEMRSLDYPLGQGFLFSRPMPSTEVDVMLAEQGGRVAGERS
jgi:EAL domain-containing protein (putative c-di-GMP-specific phosphodiesterase class I)